LGVLPGFGESFAQSINRTGQVVGYSDGPTEGGVVIAQATQWSGGSIINLGGLPGYTQSIASGINDAGQVVGQSIGCQATRIAARSASTIRGRRWE
jgi:probable HAF family extracellular repeat protein